MKVIRLLLILALCIFASSAEARSKKKDAGPEILTIYVFGVSQNISDSVIYVTAISPVNGATLLPHDILENRQYYSEQLKNYVEQTLGVPRQTAAIFYARERKKIEKRFAKTQQKLEKHAIKGAKFQNISNEQFHFKVPVIVQADDEDF